MERDVRLKTGTSHFQAMMWRGLQGLWPNQSRNDEALGNPRKAAE
jgi:hypothetical protein